MISRRSLLLGSSAAMAAAQLRSPGAQAQGAGGFDFENPLDNVTAYLKLRASVETQDVYFWFSGGLDMAVPGAPIKPVIETETMLLRRTVRIADDQWNVTDWEATFYRDAESGQPVTELVNPITGRTVRPIHYREGPVPFLFSTNEPRLIGIRDVLKNTGKPFRYPWRIVDGTLWMTKASYIDTRHWLDPREYPLASSGERL